MSVTVSRDYSLSYRPAVARGIIIVALAAGVTAGFAVGVRAAPVPDVELLHLLRAMAVLKVAFIAAAAGAVWWRLQAPIGPSWLVAYATVFGAMAAGPVLIWYSSHLILASVLLHAGIAAALLLLWRENAAADLLRGVVARRRSLSRG